MTTFIEHKEGKVYDPAHLRPFDLELAKQGHPCALYNGSAIANFRRTGGLWSLDYWQDIDGTWQVYLQCSDADLNNALRLAPIAVKDGRPLHVGDEIEVEMAPDIFIKVAVVDGGSRIVSLVSAHNWRFADEVTK